MKITEKHFTEYQCEICDNVYLDEISAKRCEERGVRVCLFKEARILKPQSKGLKEEGVTVIKIGFPAKKARSHFIKVICLVEFSNEERLWYRRENLEAWDGEKEIVFSSWDEYSFYIRDKHEKCIETTSYQLICLE